MNRPYIFCHMMTSLDGKIMGKYMETPEGSAAGNVFYNISFGKNPYYKHQGWLSGRVTTDDNCRSALRCRARRSGTAEVFGCVIW
jgi:hypothetical protein